MALLFTAACDDGGDIPQEQSASGDSTRLLISVTGFSGPEAVRYDPSQDVYFVSNFNGPGNDADNNGFISRIGPDGDADHQAVRGFHRVTGVPLPEADFTSHQTGFLSDVTVGPDGAVYVTDTGTDRVFRIYRSHIEVAFEDSLLNMPNGITWDEDENRFIVVPYGGTHSFVTWNPGADSLQNFATSPGSKFDGVEVLGGGEILVASQEDSSLHLVTDGNGQAFVHLDGRPADIGYDPSRNRVAVPYVAQDVVEIWQLSR